MYGNIIMVKRYTAVFPQNPGGPDGQWTRPGKTSRGPLWLLDEDLQISTVPISISASTSRSYSGVLETGKNNF